MTENHFGILIYNNKQTTQWKKKQDKMYQRYYH